jgi:hypothetical protein
LPFPVGPALYAGPLAPRRSDASLSAAREAALIVR